MVLLTEWILQSNSTVTTTVFRQTSSAPLFDWIINALLQTTVTDWIMVAVTVALVYYARVTILEGNKARRADSIERQLTNLYNPMFELLDQAKPFEYKRDAQHEGEWHEGMGLKDGKYHRVTQTDHTKLRAILVNYGHYLNKSEHDNMRQLLSETGEVVYDTRDVYYYGTYYSRCLNLIREKQEGLSSDLRKLT